MGKQADAPHRHHPCDVRWEDLAEVLKGRLPLGKSNVRHNNRVNLERPPWVVHLSGKGQLARAVLMKNSAEVKKQDPTK